MITASSPSTAVRSNLTGWVGTKITVGTSPLVVTDLGRWVKSGNSQTHTLHMVRASDNVEVAGARVTVNTSGATSGQFLYGTLVAPVTLEANGVYYVLSQETNSGDGWYDTNTAVSTVTGVAVNASVLVDSTGAITLTTGSASCGPVSFKATPATWTNSKETHYLYDGMLVVQERDASNTPQVSYTRGKDLSGSRRGAGGIGGLLAYTGGGVSQYYHSDSLGNVTALANVNNQLSAAYTYDPYGNLLGSSGPMADLNHYRFSSKEIHPGSGTYAYGYRFYDPNLQRWLNRDPIGENGGINLYGFVKNRPTAKFDPVGWSDFNRPPETVQSPSPNCPVDQANSSYGPPAGEPDTHFHRWGISDVIEDIYWWNVGNQLKHEQWVKELSPSQRYYYQVFKIEEPILLGQAGLAAEGAVAAESVAGENFVYRGLADGEDAANGLSARAPNAGNTPASHVAGKRASQWISTTKCKATAMQKYGKGDVVRIDLNKVANQVVDLSGGLPGKPGMLLNWAIKDREVLIQYYVPPDAIELIKWSYE